MAYKAPGAERRIHGGGTQVEVHLGAYEDLTKIQGFDQWVSQTEAKLLAEHIRRAHAGRSSFAPEISPSMRSSLWP